MVKSASDPLALQTAIQAEVDAIDPALVVHHVRRLEEVVSGAIARERFAMLLMSVFGWTALLLSVVGIYGVLTYLVAERTREIGIRVAVGARAMQILRTVVGRALVLTGVGALVGCAAALAGGRWLESYLFEVSTSDALTFAAAIVLTLVATMVACFGPAARALRVSPTEALRQD